MKTIPDVPAEYVEAAIATIQQYPKLNLANRMDKVNFHAYRESYRLLRLCLINNLYADVLSSALDSSPELEILLDDLTLTEEIQRSRAEANPELDALIKRLTNKAQS